MSRLTGLRLVAGCDVAPDARERAARWGIARVYTEPGAMLEAERPEITIVATPPLTHADLAVLALNAGSHVFCEKPFAPSVDAADRVLEAARSPGRLVAVNNQYYQMPIFRTVQTLLSSGRSGRLYHIDVWQHMHLLPDAEGGWKAALQPRRVLYEFGTHALDLICQFMGAYPTAVSAKIPRVREEVDADVLVLLRLDFPGERTATVVLNRVSHAPKKYLEMRLNCDEAAIRTSLGGVARLALGWNSVARRPRLRFDLASGGAAWWERDGRVRTLARQPYSAFHTACADHFAAFLAAIRTGEAPPVSGAHAREVLRVVFTAYESASREGELVRIDRLGVDEARLVAG